MLKKSSGYTNYDYQTWKTGLGEAQNNLGAVPKPNDGKVEPLCVLA